MMLEIIAHRGASHEAPENTVAAARLAFAQNADAVEIDVHLSRDRKIVVMHDDNTRRTTGHHAPIAEQSLADLKKLDAGSWKNARFENERVPQLEEILAVVPPGKRFFIEVKCGAEIVAALARVLAEALQNGFQASQLVVIGFDFETLSAAKRALPELPMLWLLELSREARPAVKTIIEAARAANFEGVDVGAGTHLDAALVEEFHAAQLQFYVWTVDDFAEARRLQTLGVDGITTNRPAWLRAQIESGDLR